MSHRLKIAVDIDDVLAKHVEGFVRYSNETWQGTLTAADYTEDWPKTWGVSRSEALARAAKIHSPEVMGEYDCIESAKTVLESLAVHHTLIVITSRRVETRELTEQWVDTYFPNIFESISMAGLWDNANTASAINLTKGDICESLGVDVLIDDQLKHCYGVAERGIHSIIYGDYEWNKEDCLPEKVTRCQSWKEIADYFADVNTESTSPNELVSFHA